MILEADNDIGRSRANPGLPPDPAPPQSATVMLLFVGLVVASVAVFFVSYLVLYEVPTTCSGRDDVACIINANSGLVAADALLVAVFSFVFTGYLSSEAFKGQLAAEANARVRKILDEQQTQLARAREDARAARFDRLVFETVYEAAHNLQHLASSSTPGATTLDKERCRSGANDPQVWARWPEFQTLQARALLAADFEDLFAARFPGGRLWGHLDHMLRNDAFLRRFSFDRKGLAQAEEVLAYFIEYCVRVLITGAGGSELARRLITDLLHVDALAEVVKRPSQHCIVRFGASWVQKAVDAERPDARDAELALCWFDDRPASSTHAGISRRGMPCIPLHELGVAFKRVSDPPPRP